MPNAGSIMRYEFSTQRRGNNFDSDCFFDKIRKRSGNEPKCLTYV